MNPRPCKLAKLALGLILAAAPLYGDDQATPILSHHKPRYLWGGWFGGSYGDNSLSGDRSSLGLNHAYLYLDLRLDKAWQVFGEGSFEREVDEFGQAESEALLERLFVNYKLHRGLQLRLGRFNTRSGIVKPLHWDITLDTVQPPVMESNDYVPAKSNGLEVWGNLLSKTGSWHYSLSLSYSDDEIDRRDPVNEARSAGIDLYYQRPSRYRAGASIFFYGDPSNNRRTVTVFYPYGEWWLIPHVLQWRTELMHLESRGQEALHSLYSKIKWQITQKWYLNYRYDYGHDLRISEQAKHRVHTLTAAFWPKNQWRWKAEYARHKLDDATPFNQWSIWTGYVF